MKTAGSFRWPLAGALLIAVVAWVAPAGFTPARAEDPVVKPDAAKAPHRILFVGNSYLYYNDSLHNHVRRMAIAADPALEKQLKYKSATIGGAALADHTITSYLDYKKLRVGKPFDLVVLQGGSFAASSEEKKKSFTDAATAFDAEIKKTGARTALYMTHAYVKPHKKVSPTMTRDLEALYTSVGNKLGALVIPVGLAFEESYKQRPDLRLHKDYDGSHPNMAGTYLAACVVYASLYGKSPIGNPYDYYGAVDKDTAAYLQKVAETTVKKFYKLP